MATTTRFISSSCFFKDGQQNNCLHIIAERDNKKNKSKSKLHFVEFFEHYLLEKYQLEAYKMLGDLLAAKNKNGQTPEQITQDDKLKNKFQQLTQLAAEQIQKKQRPKHYQ